MQTTLKNTISSVLVSLLTFFRFPKPRVTILGYHTISSDDTIIDIKKKEFLKQIRYLKQQGYHFITLDEVVLYAQGKISITHPSVVFTFDDGYADLLDAAAPILAKEGIPATYYVISHPERVDRISLENNKPLLNKHGIAELATFPGSDIQGHTTGHWNVAAEDYFDLVDDVSEAKRILENVTKKKVSFFAYPWGSYSQQAIAALRQSGYISAVTADAGFIFPGQNLFLLPRIMVDRTHTIEQFRLMLTFVYPPIVKIRTFFRKLTMTSTLPERALHLGH